MDICVTGASRGLGLALTTEFLRRGHRVYAVARTTDALRSLEQTSNGKLLVSAVDIAREESVREWTDAMKARGFNPEIVVFNASVQVDDLTDDGFDFAKAASTVDINLTGTLRCLAAFLPTMLQQKSGSLVTISSTAGLRPSMRSVGYGASKAGVEMAMRTLRLKHAGSGVRLASVILGPVATEMWEGRTSALVPSPAKAASAIAEFALSGRTRMYFPRLTTLLLRLSFWLPDSVFAFVSAKLLK